MFLDGFIIQTKLAPPHVQRRTLHRARLAQRLLEALDYRLTIVQAGAGYGKSTMLAGLASAGHPLVWYHLDEQEADPLVFLLYLLHGFKNALGGLVARPLAMLEEWDAATRPWPVVVDALVNEIALHTDQPILLVIDDAHKLSRAPDLPHILDRLIRHAPANLHTILSTRYPINLESLINLRVRGEVLEIGEEDLAFTPDEIRTLFREQYHLALSDEEVDLLARETEGWAIALQLVWQGLPQGQPSHLPAALKRLAQMKGDLFTYLAQEVLAQQPPHIQDFLMKTSVLRRMTAELCDCLRGADDSDEILEHLVESGLFVARLNDEHIRYHNLFHEFLYRRLSEAERQAAHLKAGACHLRREEYEEAIHHFIRGGAAEEAAGVIEQIGRGMVLAGRLEALAGWLAALPAQTTEVHPRLLNYQGDIARLHSRFEEALRLYQQAEERCRAWGDTSGVAQALRGQARVYLDTVNPSKAEHPLREALRLSDGQGDRESLANLLELLAENQLNLGRVDEAVRLQTQARQVREEGPEEAGLDMRVMLRTGRLEEARQRLEERARIEREEPVLRPRAHRETLLILSLIQSFQGEGEAAFHNAVEGTQRGEALNSPFVTAVGYMRQGHAWLVREAPDRHEQALRCFEQAIAISEKLAVDRLKVEAFWGMCHAYGTSGDTQQAETLALQGIDIAQQAGDEWITAHLRMALGAAYVLAERREEAVPWLSAAYSGFHECGDTFGMATVRLWQSLIWYEEGDEMRLTHALDDLLEGVAAHSYDSLLTRRTLIGPPDPRRIVPLLLFARSHSRHGGRAHALLKTLGLERLELHPGYRLRVQTLGTFRVWRGDVEVDAGGWQREKARQLFQLLITWRGTLLERDKICDMLWPDLSAEAAASSFKVALNAVYQALEPGRPRGGLSAYVMRQGTLYGLRPEADLWLDAHEFERLIAAGDALFQGDRGAALDHYRHALALYQGDYLEEFIYEDWCREERARLRMVYLRSAERLAEALVEAQQWEETLRTCEAILARDDCWEHAYRLMMISYMALGRRPQALQTYQRLVRRLHDELDTIPSEETIRLYEQIAAPPSDLP